MKAGEIYTRRKGDWTTYALIVDDFPLRATIIEICEDGPIVLHDHRLIFSNYADGMKRATWTDWAGAVARMTDHLLDLPTEVME